MSTNPLTVTAPEGVPFIDFEREFDAPVAAVFRAHAEPDLLVQWLGPRGYEMKIDHFEFRTGGGYRYIHTGDDGQEYAFNGVFHTVRPNDFAIQTFEFEGFPDVVSIESMTFEDLGGGAPGSAATASIRPRRPATGWSPAAWSPAWPRVTTALTSYWSVSLRNRRLRSELDEPAFGRH